MRLTAWTWIIFGSIITAMSGYIYLFIPKNGQPNNAMAIFFFIGILFIVIGIAKLLFKRVDDKEVFDSVEKSIQNKPEKMVQMPITEGKPNRIDEAINSIANQHSQSNIAARQHQHAQSHTTHTVQRQHHSNSYYQAHQYRGPVHNPSTNTHAQHPVSQHVHSAQHTSHIQNSADHGIKCHKCGNINSGHANYCHGCGNRLK